uniref:GATA-type domain-containing protein n=1 Tax=Heterorhabditis bacteriophora TaxID=37862 RepID=A0A1I7XD99_HETBA
MLQVSFDSAVPTLSYNFKSCTQCNHPPARTRSKKLAIAKKLCATRVALHRTYVIMILLQ